MTKLFAYHLEPSLMEAVLEKLGELPYDEVWDIIGDLLIEHKLATHRPVVAETGQLKIERNK